MPVVEIIDKRTQYRVVEYDAVVEDASNDGTLFVQPYLPLGPENAWEQSNKSIQELLKWANEFPHPVVLFLYDAGALGNEHRR